MVKEESGARAPGKSYNAHTMNSWHITWNVALPLMVLRSAVELNVVFAFIARLEYDS